MAGVRLTEVPSPAIFRLLCGPRRFCDRPGKAILIRTIGAAAAGVARGASVVIFLTCAAQAAPEALPVQPPEQPPPEIRELLGLLAKPAVRDWLEEQRTSGGATANAAPAEEETLSSHIAARVAAIHDHLTTLVATLPTLPGDLRQAGARLLSTARQAGLTGTLALLLAVLAIGWGLEQLFRHLTQKIGQRLRCLPIATVRDRLRGVGARLGLDLGAALAFALGTIGVFVVLDLPPVLKEIALGYLAGALAFRLVRVLVRLLLSPGDASFRITPVSDDAARFWDRRVGLLAGWLIFGLVTAESLSMLGVSHESRQIVAYTLGIGLLVITIETSWRRPWTAIDRFGADAPRMGTRAKHGFGAWLRLAYFVALWLLWVASALPMFWFAVFVLALPAALSLTQRSIDHLLRFDGESRTSDEPLPLLTVVVERGARALLIIGSALLLARAWHVDLLDLTARETTMTRLLSGGLSAVVIVLIADLLWHVAKTAIDRKIVPSQLSASLSAEEERRQMRLRTLLPVLRNIVLILIVTLTIMMVLAHLGVEIGPLIASAGIIGIAVGFGAQTLVRDVITGSLFLLDDAFRLGEYIESGNYKGTVEAIGFRSIKLRHHRGPLFTIPFGVLGAVKNTSRDWVIDKILVGVTYDTDLGKVKSLIKEVGKELVQDTEFAPHIIEPLKMQGVSQFGDFAIQIQLKMMTKPNQQFMIRRRALALIKKAFEADGIKFAFPTVQVAGTSAPGNAAAAQTALELVRGGLGQDQHSSSR